MKILLHACCGPCSLEPVRLLAEEGHQLTIAYTNSNIHPADEYRRRLETLLTWANSQGIPIIEDAYDPKSWFATVGEIQKNGSPRESRCRQCYRERLERTAQFAFKSDFEGIATTLTVSPYQYTQIIAEELERACAPYGLIPVFRDFRPYYPQATLQSKNLEMYRQNYCGCIFSDKEAELERRERKAARKIEQERRAAERAPIEAELERQRKEKAARQAEYDRKQQAKKAMRKKIREQLKTEEKIKLN